MTLTSANPEVTWSRAIGARAVEERLIKKLMASMKCDSCGRHYESYNIDILGHREDMWFLRVLCSTCHTQCLVAAVVREEKVPAALNDLTAAEINGHRREKIEIDDVLDMHNFLIDFNGDFSKLFGQKRLR
jgi:ferredoxin